MQTVNEHGVYYCNNTVIAANPHHVYTLYFNNNDRAHERYVFDLKVPVKPNRCYFEGLMSASDCSYTQYTEYLDVPFKSYVEIYLNGILIEYGEISEIDPMSDSRDITLVDYENGLVCHGTYTRKMRCGGTRKTQYYKGTRNGWDCIPNQVAKIVVERFYDNGDYIGERVRDSNGAITQSTFTPEQCEKYRI